MATLNTDGGITINGVTLTKAQVAAVKAAKSKPKPKEEGRTGYWLVSPNRSYRYYLGRRIKHPPKARGYRDSYVQDADGAAVYVTDKSWVIIWATFA